MKASTKNTVAMTSDNPATRIRWMSHLQTLWLVPIVETRAQKLRRELAELEAAEVA